MTENKPTFVLYFIKLIKQLRPTATADLKGATINILNVINELEENAEKLRIYQEQCQQLLISTDIQEIFTDSNDVFGSTSVFEQLSKDIKYSILPPLWKKSSFIHLFQEIFNKKTDYIWVNALPKEYWVRLFELSGITQQFIDKHLKYKLQNAALILSYKIAGLGLDNEFVKSIKTDKSYTAPFLEQNKEIVFYFNDQHSQYNNADLKAANTNRHIIVLLSQCVAIVGNIRRSSATQGTSLKQTYLLNKTDKNIYQLKLLLSFFDVAEFNKTEFVDFFKSVLYNENNKYSIRHTLSKNIGSLAYQIAEHKSAVGEHYIANKKRAFIEHFKAAFGGGFIITAMVFFKVAASSLQLTDFWKALLYSIIYATGFVVIHLLGFTVATKQPAMTASSLAKELDNEHNNKNKLNNIVILMAQVSRSQIIAVIGNLLAVFPTTLLFVLLLDKGFHYAITDSTHAWKYLQEIHPTYSLSAWYAMIAGFYLFLSGIIIGYIDNMVIYSKIPERIRQKPHWLRWLGTQRIQKLSHYIADNFGAIMGNIAIGFFLGTASFIGTTLGLPFDIRHITISTGLFAIGIETLNFQIGLNVVFSVIIGLFTIGVFNILSSFGLAFYVALKSRNIAIKQLTKLPKLLLVYFIKHPLDFFYPPKTERIETDIFPKNP